MKIENSFPINDGYMMPGEFEKHHGTMMIWPYRRGSWKNEAAEARKIFAEIANNIAENEAMYMLIRASKASDDYETAKKLLSDKVKLIEIDTDDAWARDTGATFVRNTDNDIRGVNWVFNAWGGEYNGLYASWDKDDKVAEGICNFLNKDYYDAAPFVLEGGSIHSDGEGTILVTEECLLSKGRNPKLSKEEIEDKLKKYLGATKVIWIPYGIYNDETDGHIDNICAFSAPGEVILAWTDDENDPQYDRSSTAYNILSETEDAKGRKLKVHKLPIPSKPILINEEDLEGYVFEEGEDTREIGERLAASYVNFYIANNVIILPQFGDENDKKAVEILSECFPDRKVIPIMAREILTGGGNIHCITQQIPYYN